MGFILAIAAALAILIVNGMIQQERVRLWRHHQDYLAEQARQKIEDQKRAATERVRDMLRSRREAATGSAELRVSDDADPASAQPGEEAPPEDSWHGRTITRPSPN
jgi:uncharacterized membrane protein YhiD involved in acid resistance